MHSQWWWWVVVCRGGGGAGGGWVVGCGGWPSLDLDDAHGYSPMAMTKEAGVATLSNVAQVVEGATLQGARSRLWRPLSEGHA